MISAPISPCEALGRVVDATSGGGVELGVPGSVEWKHAIAVQEQAERRLQTACASRQQTVFVVDPRNGNRIALRPDCFERSGSQTIFHRDRFQVWDFDAWTIDGEDYDPLFKTLREYNGWCIGLEEPHFSAWLEVLGARNVDASAPGKALADHRHVEVERPIPTRSRGRPPAPYWAKYDKAVMEILAEEGYPQLGDGGQARLERIVGEKIAADGIEPPPSESTIRLHVHRCITRYREELQLFPTR